MIPVSLHEKERTVIGSQRSRLMTQTFARHNHLSIREFDERGRLTYGDFGGEKWAEYHCCVRGKIPQV